MKDDSWYMEFCPGANTAVLPLFQVFLLAYMIQRQIMMDDNMDAIQRAQGRTLQFAAAAVMLYCIFGGLYYTLDMQLFGLASIFMIVFAFMGLTGNPVTSEEGHKRYASFSGLWNYILERAPPCVPKIRAFRCACCLCDKTFEFWYILPLLYGLSEVNNLVIFNWIFIIMACSILSTMHCVWIYGSNNQVTNVGVVVLLCLLGQHFYMVEYENLKYDECTTILSGDYYETINPVKQGMNYFAMFIVHACIGNGALLLLYSRNEIVNHELAEDLGKTISHSSQLLAAEIDESDEEDTISDIDDPMGVLMQQSKLAKEQMLLVPAALLEAKKEFSKAYAAKMRGEDLNMYEGYKPDLRTVYEK